MDHELKKLTSEAALDMADNPFAAVGVSWMNQMSDNITQGFDTAIGNECNGESGAIARFFKKLSSIGEEASDSSRFKSPEHTSYRSSEPVVIEEPTVKTFSCVAVAEPSLLEDEMVFRVENNCGTKISLVNWDVNIFEPGTNKLIDTGILQIGDFYDGSEKQDNVYLSIPGGEFRYELVPSSASPDEVLANGVRSVSPDQSIQTTESPMAQSGVEAETYVESSDGEANLRPFASTENTPLGVLVNGDTVTILEETTNSSSQHWVRVDSRLGEGWVYSKLVKESDQR